MSDCLAELCKKVDALGTRLGELACQLAEAADGLKQKGRLPAEPPFAQWEQARRTFRELRDEVAQVARTEEIEPPMAFAEVDSLAEIKDFLRKIAETKVAKKARTVVPAARKSQIRDQLLRAIQHDAEIPAFSATTRRLMDLISHPQVMMEEVADVVALDPGLASKYLKLANSAAFGGNSIAEVKEALIRLGFSEIRRVANAIEVLGCFSFLQHKVDWNLFWLHSMLTARLTMTLAHAYRPTSGKEYLAALVHDVGKLFLEHYFPDQLDAVLACSAETGTSLHEAEQMLLDVTHPEAGEALCRRWKLDEEICFAVRYHHEPPPMANGAPSATDKEFLPICLCVADSVANLCNANIAGGKKPDEVNFESSPEWALLQSFTPRLSLDMDMAEELHKAQDTMSTLMGP